MKVQWQKLLPEDIEKPSFGQRGESRWSNE